VCQWSSRSGAPIRRPLTLSGLELVGLLPGGNMALMGSADTTKDTGLTLLSSDDGHRIAKTATASLGFWTSATASRDGQKILASWYLADMPAQAVIWDRTATKSSELATQSYAKLAGPVFTGDELLIAGIPTNEADHTWLQFWNLDGKWADLEAPALTDGIDLTASPDGRRLAIASSAGTVQIWRPFRFRWVDTEPIAPTPGGVAQAATYYPSGGSSGAIFTPDGREGAVLKDGLLQILGAGPQRTIIRQFAADKLYEVTPDVSDCLALSQDGKLVANCEYKNLDNCNDCTDVIVRDVLTGNILLRKLYRGDVVNVSFGTTGQTLVVLWNSVYINYVTSAAATDVIDLKGATIGSVPPVPGGKFARISPDGHHVAILFSVQPMYSDPGGFGMRIWDFKTGRALGPVLSYPDGFQVTDLGFEDDGRVSLTVTTASGLATRAWQLDPAISLHGTALVERACAVVLSGGMSRRAQVEFNSAPMLDRKGELDACNRQ
jgi:dipeptidyl aminopeptidase/acylaminoacyl peptidase